MYPPCTSLWRIRWFCRLSRLLKSISCALSIRLRIPTPPASTIFPSIILPSISLRDMQPRKSRLSEARRSQAQRLAEALSTLVLSFHDHVPPGVSSPRYTRLPVPCTHSAQTTCLLVQLIHENFEFSAPLLPESRTSKILITALAFRGTGILGIGNGPSPEHFQRRFSIALLY